jgi:hypothetical protein
MKLPIQLQQNLLDTMKSAQLDPRKYPVIQIHWSGCGDDGGIEDIFALTQQGKETVIEHGHLPDYGKEEHVACTVQTRRGMVPPRTFNVQVNLNEHRHGHNYELDRWVYDKFDLCEVNEGGYGNIYVDLATRKVWGQSYNWVTEDVENVIIYYED